MYFFWREVDLAKRISNKWGHKDAWKTTPKSQSLWAVEPLRILLRILTAAIIWKTVASLKTSEIIMRQWESSSTIGPSKTPTTIQAMRMMKISTTRVTMMNSLTDFKRSRRTIKLEMASIWISWPKGREWRISANSRTASTWEDSFPQIYNNWTKTV